jgi:hypothetical protein
VPKTQQINVAARAAVAGAVAAVALASALALGVGYLQWRIGPNPSGSEGLPESKHLPPKKPGSLADLETEADTLWSEVGNPAPSGDRLYVAQQLLAAVEIDIAALPNPPRPGGGSIYGAGLSELEKSELQKQVAATQQILERLQAQATEICKANPTIEAKFREVTTIDVDSLSPAERRWLDLRSEQAKASDKIQEAREKLRQEDAARKHAEASKALYAGLCARKRRLEKLVELEERIKRSRQESPTVSGDGVSS